MWETCENPPLSVCLCTEVQLKAVGVIEQQSVPVLKGFTVNTSAL